MTTPLPLSSAEVSEVIAAGKVTVRRVCAMACDKHTGAAASVHPDGAGVGWIAWWPNPVSAEQTKRLYPGEDGFLSPFGKVGDVVWVREAVAGDPHNSLSPVHYFADGPLSVEKRHDAGLLRRYSARYCPRWASRLSLRLASLTVERSKDARWEWVATFERVKP